MSGFKDGASEANLAALFRAQAGMSQHDGRALLDHLVGGLSCYVAPEDFARVLDAAVGDVERVA